MEHGTARQTDSRRRTIGPSLCCHHWLDLCASYFWRRAQTHGGKSRRAFIFCCVGGAACRVSSGSDSEVSWRSFKVDLAGVCSWSSVASATDARRRLVFRKIHINARTSHGGTCDANNDAFGNGCADVGDEPAFNPESVPPFYDF